MGLRSLAARIVMHLYFYIKNLSIDKGGGGVIYLKNISEKLMSWYNYTSLSMHVWVY